MKALPPRDVRLHSIDNVDALKAAIELGRSRTWPTLVQIRCGVTEDGKACGRKLPQAVVATPRGPFVWGRTSDPLFRDSFLKPTREKKRWEGERWQMGETLYGFVVDGFPPPQTWWWAACPQHNEAVVILDRLRADVQARRKTHLTVAIVLDDSGMPHLP